MAARHDRNRLVAEQLAAQLARAEGETVLTEEMAFVVFRAALDHRVLKQPMGRPSIGATRYIAAAAMIFVAVLLVAATPGGC